MIQRAWYVLESTQPLTCLSCARWDGISAMYSRADAPARVALEMRLTGSSEVHLAPQRGNKHGTISIEILTTLATPPADWASFMQLVADRWTSYADAAGNLLPARPHWAKQWQGLSVRGMPIEQYFQQIAYKDAFAMFRSTYTKIVERRGCSVDQSLKMFGVDTMTRLIFG